MKQTTIKVGGKELPCRLTMGAMLQFKRETGKDVSELENGGNLEELLLFMYCCVKCACKAEDKDFEADFETFCCMVTPQDVAQWSASMNGGETKKKGAAES